MGIVAFAILGREVSAEPHNKERYVAGTATAAAYAPPLLLIATQKGSTSKKRSIP